MRKLLLTTALTALLAAPAVLAQDNQTGTNIQLLNRGGLQDELKLTEKQKEKLAEIAKTVAKDFKSAKEALAKFRKDDLTPAQTKRLRQIELQRFGFEAFEEEDAGKALKLTEGQKAELRKIAAEARKESKKLRADAGKDPKKLFETQKKIAQLNHDARAKFVRSLSDRQQKAWKELVGEPYTIRPGSVGVRPKKDE
jgi:hypothetical protein